MAFHSHRNYLIGRIVTPKQTPPSPRAAIRLDKRGAREIASGAHSEKAQDERRGARYTILTKISIHGCKSPMWTHATSHSPLQMPLCTAIVYAILSKEVGGLPRCLSNKGLAKEGWKEGPSTKNRRKSNRARKEGFVFINAVIARAPTLRRPSTQEANNRLPPRPPLRNRLSPEIKDALT